MLAVIPILLCALSLNLLYVLIDKKIVGFLDRFIEVRQIPGLGIVLLAICLYLIGLVASNIIGRQVLRFLENITQKIPFLGSIYGIGKQLTRGFSATGKKQAFKKALLIKLSGNDLWVPAFVMNTLKSRKTAEDLFLVYVPTVPTPTGGFVFIVKAS